MVCSLNSPAWAQSGKIAEADETTFKITVENLSNYDLAPGGYVVHASDFRLFEVGKVGSPAVKALCESGRTPDFLYYVRRGLKTGKAFSFDGGVKAKSKVEALFVASKDAGLLSFMHKVSFTDDTCSGQDGVALFTRQGNPIRSEVVIYPLDGGTKENLKTSAPKNEMLAQFSWSYWKNQDTIPAVAIVESRLL